MESSGRFVTNTLLIIGAAMTPLKKAEKMSENDSKRTYGLFIEG